MKNLDNLIIEKEVLKNVQKNIDYNQIILDYYDRFSEENIRRSKTIDNKMERMQDCNKFWSLNVYEMQKIKEFMKTNLCRDKFCNNCKKVKQGARMKRFSPHIKDYKQDLFQLTLTIPNVEGRELGQAIDLLFSSYTKLTRMLKKKNPRIKELADLNYRGSIRSFEITYKMDDYHPHLHCAMVFDGYEPKKAVKVNNYSYSNGKLTRRFTEMEILIQKIWYLLINDFDVTKENINDLEIGYSCTLDKFKEDDFLELFKYMTKSTDEENKPLTYENFKVLHDTLNGRRQIQGYGVFYGLKDSEDEEEFAFEVEEKFEELINELKEKEIPIKTAQTVKDLINDKEFKLISKNNFAKIMREENKKEIGES